MVSLGREGYRRYAKAIFETAFAMQDVSPRMSTIDRALNEFQAGLISSLQTKPQDLFVVVADDEHVEMSWLAGCRDRLGHGDLNALAQPGHSGLDRVVGRELFLLDHPGQNREAQQLLRNGAKSFLVVEGDCAAQDVRADGRRGDANRRARFVLLREVAHECEPDHHGQGGGYDQPPLAPGCPRR